MAFMAEKNIDMQMHTKMFHSIVNHSEYLLGTSKAS